MQEYDFDRIKRSVAECEEGAITVTEMLNYICFVCGSDAGEFLAQFSSVKDNNVTT